MWDLSLPLPQNMCLENFFCPAFLSLSNFHPKSWFDLLLKSSHNLWEKKFVKYYVEIFPKNISFMLGLLLQWKYFACDFLTKKERMFFFHRKKDFFYFCDWKCSLMVFKNMCLNNEIELCVFLQFTLIFNLNFYTLWHTSNAIYWFSAAKLVTSLFTK